MRIQDLITEHKDNMADFMSALEDFLPFVMKELKLNSLPKIKLVTQVKDNEQPTFGKYVNEKHVLYIGVKNRHIIDVLRTMAHELTHYKQDTESRLYHGAGDTGSDIENEANEIAGIIMRKFNKAHRHYFEKPALDLLESKKKKKKRPQKRSPTFRGFYGYYGDFSDNSGGDAGGDVAEAWSKKYKKSINCSNPKGFSQRAHCAGRKARRAGKKTKSVSVSETTIKENFADGKKPGRKGLSKRVGIPKKATLSNLKNIAKNSTGERRRMAQWQLNMRRGRNKNK